MMVLSCCLCQINKEDIICTTLCCELTSIHHTDESMALLRYIAESSDSDSGTESTPRHRYDVVRPGPLHYRRCLKDALHLMNTDILPPSPHQADEWSSALTGLISPRMIAAQARVNLLGDEVEKLFDYLRYCLLRQVFAVAVLALTVPKRSGAAYLFFFM